MKSILVTCWLLTCCFVLPAVAQPQRIVSLSPVTTEMCYALGLDKQLVAVTADCDYPAAAKKKPQIGKFGSVDLERLILAKPDLLLATQDMAPRLSAVKRLNVPLITFETPHLPAIADNMLKLGQIAGKGKEAKAWHKTWIQRLKQLERRPSQRRAFFVLWPQPLVSASRTSFIGDLLFRAGLHNPVTTPEPFPQIGWEQLLGYRPDVVVTSLRDTHHFREGRWQQLTALKEGQLIQLNPDWVERPGPRSILGLQQLVEALR